MGKLSKDKGKRFERELVRMFSNAAPFANISRGFQFRSGGEAPDVDLPGFWLEAKVGARTNARKALRQATATARAGRWPLAVCKDDRDRPVCSMWLNDFLPLYRQWLARRLEIDLSGQASTVKENFSEPEEQQS